MEAMVAESREYVMTVPLAFGAAVAR